MLTVCVQRYMLSTGPLGCRTNGYYMETRQLQDEPQPEYLSKDGWRKGGRQACNTLVPMRDS